MPSASGNVRHVPNWNVAGLISIDGSTGLSSRLMRTLN
jgi:hypothetical protein